METTWIWSPGLQGMGLVGGPQVTGVTGRGPGGRSSGHWRCVVGQFLGESDPAVSSAAWLPDHLIFLAHNLPLPSVALYTDVKAMRPPDLEFEAPES